MHVCKRYIDQTTHNSCIMVIMKALSLSPLSDACGTCDQSAQRKYDAGWYRGLGQAEFNQVGCLHLSVYGLPSGGHQTVPQTRLQRG